MTMPVGRFEPYPSYQNVSGQKIKLIFCLFDNAFHRKRIVKTATHDTVYRAMPLLEVASFSPIKASKGPRRKFAESQPMKLS